MPPLHQITACRAQGIAGTEPEEVNDHAITADPHVSQTAQWDLPIPKGTNPPTAKTKQNEASDPEDGSGEEVANTYNRLVLCSRLINLLRVI